MNYLKTTIFLALLTMLLMFMGGMIGGRSGMTTAFIFAAVMNLGAYWYSDKLVLAMYRAVPLDETEAPQVYRILYQLTAKAGMPMPRVYRLPMAVPNAFATGRNPENAVVAVTDGILELLSEEELEGVLGHELAHVKHQDILISSVAATIAGAISMLANMARWGAMSGGWGGRRDDRQGIHPAALLFTSIFAPVAALLIQLAVSRSREFHADEFGASLAASPLYLANALRKLEAKKHAFPPQDINPATAHLFIVNPLRGGLASLFSTHPPIEERIARLEQMAR